MTGVFRWIPAVLAAAVLCSPPEARARSRWIQNPPSPSAESPQEAAEGWTLTFLDPLRHDAARHVRYEQLPGVSDEAIAIVEREDKRKGFSQYAAILVVRRGKRQVSALSSTLAGRERVDALRVLAELGKAIAKRLG